MIIKLVLQLNNLMTNNKMFDTFCKYVMIIIVLSPCPSNAVQYFTIFFIKKPIIFLSTNATVRAYSV